MPPLPEEAPGFVAAVFASDMLAEVVGLGSRRH